MSNMPWKEAIIRVLQESDETMHYADIAAKIVEDGLRSSVGATPAATVNSYINTSLKEDGKESPFIRVGRGEYFLRSKSEELEEAEQAKETQIQDAAESSAIIRAFGIFWKRDLVLWGSNPKLLGRQQIGADPVDFSGQLGVYLLYDAREVIYVGRSVDRPIGKRLYEHTQDRLGGRWDRFSWFGLLSVTEDGDLEKTDGSPSFETIIGTLEAVLIEGLEPSQNRRRGDVYNAIEYMQAQDPEIERQQMKSLLNQMQQKLA